MGGTSTLLVSEFAMLIFHKAVGAYFENCTITIEAQTRTHGPSIKHGIRNQMCKCKCIVRSQLHWESYTKATFFKENQTCNKLNTCWLRKGLGNPHQQYQSQIATQNQRPNCQWPLAKGHWPIANGELLMAIWDLWKTHCVCF